MLGVDPWRLGPQLRSRLGWAPEDDSFPGDVRAHDLVCHVAEVHGLPHRAATSRTSEVLHLVGLNEERLRPLGTLSAGQRQRVKVAQAIVHDPVLVFLDEPTNGLDPFERQRMLALLRSVRDSMRIDIVLCSHLLSEIEQVCDSAVILNAGTVAACGSLDVLRRGSDDIAVELDGPAGVLVDVLAAVGIEASLDGNCVLVPRRCDETFDQIRDAVAATGFGLRRMGLRAPTLEEVFLDAAGTTPPSNGSRP